MAAQLHFGTGDSIGFGTTDAGTSTTATFARSALSNMRIGDLLVAYIHCQTGVSSQTITAPSGWVAYGPAPGSPSWPISRLASVYYYAIKSQADLNNLPSMITWSFSISGSRVACVVARATGIDLDNIEDAQATTVTAGSANASSLAVGGITTLSSETLLVGVAFHHNSANTTSPSTTAMLSDFQEYKTAPEGSTLANSGVALGYTDRSVSGATGIVPVTFNSPTSASGGFLVAFKAGPWTPPPPVGLDIHYTSAPDTLSTGQLFYTSATDSLSVPAEIRSVPAGYASVSAMLSTSPFYLAHRGGSANWPEMSLHAYTQSVFWGVGGLELSLSRTSDGVWFGLHDDTLDRTSGTSGFVASSHTWAEVQNYLIGSSETTDPTQPSRPYMRWEELMDSYYNSHVICVDPKASWGHHAELLDMMDALPGVPTERFIAKYYGVSSGWALAARARGYKTWGFFYNTDAANFDAYQGYWDILGMNYNAAQTYWDAIKSYGKPVIGHVVPGASEAAMAFAKGADGLMVSGVTQTIPRT